MKEEDEGWMGEVNERVQWVEREKSSREEIDLVELSKRFPPQTEPLEPLRIDASARTVSLDRLFNRIVLNSSATDSTTLTLDDSTNTSPTPSSLASILIPPSSGFLLSDFFSWSTPSSGIASLGEEVGGWDIVVIECVLVRSLVTPPYPDFLLSRQSSLAERFRHSFVQLRHVRRLRPVEAGSSGSSRRQASSHCGLVDE
jgi:hypothetical protein